MTTVLPKNCYFGDMSMTERLNNVVFELIIADFLYVYNTFYYANINNLGDMQSCNPSVAICS